MSWKDKIDSSRVPGHVAVIMDGNGRWAQQQGKLRVDGHRSGVNSVRETAEAAAAIGVKYLTLYAFSTENWNRPKEEVNALMELLVHTISAEKKTLNENNIRLETIGDWNSLPERCRAELTEAINETAKNDRMTLVLALSYSARWEITEAARQIAVELARVHRDERIRVGDPWWRLEEQRVDEAEDGRVCTSPDGQAADEDEGHCR